MDFRFTPEQEAFRREIRDFLSEELTPEMRRASEEQAEDAFYNQAFSKKVSARGWIGLSWPKEWGGQAIGHIERLVYSEEMLVAKAPVGHHFAAERQMGPSLMLHGTEEQRKEFIPRIVDADICFCIGYSEPGAGSDLAGVQTRAVADGDDYVIDGQKTYTSGAHLADYIWLAARTDPEAAKHKGISVFLVDMKTPGVTVRPLWTMGGGRFNEVYFDGVRVPKRYLVGEENGGWYVVAANLDFERSGLDRVVGGQLVFEQVLDLVRGQQANGARLRSDAVMRHSLAEAAIEFQVGRLLAYRVAWQQSRGQVPNYEASLSKVYGTEMNQRVAQRCIKALGLYGLSMGGKAIAPLEGKITRMYLSTISTTIAGGTSEIQRNIMATRGLGLPR